MKNSQILGVYDLRFLNYHTFKNVPRPLWLLRRAICGLKRFVRPMSFFLVEIEACILESNEILTQAFRIDYQEGDRMYTV